MTESTLPAARPRKILTQIAPVTWEHPADRAALQSLRSVPGFDQVVKKVVGFLGERGIRLLFQANAVRVGPTQFPRMNALYTDVLTSLDWSERPELFVSQTPFVNAGAYGMDRPFIVINSGALNLLDDDEMRVLLGHEVGHVMSGHALYHTILVLIVFVGMNFLPFLAGIILAPIEFALLEWYRKSELSSDRAGLLAAQDPTASMRMFLKMAGGGDMKQMDLNPFLQQAKEYEETGGALDRMFKIINNLPPSHPLNTLPARPLLGAEGRLPRRGSLRGSRHPRHRPARHQPPAFSRRYRRPRGCGPRAPDRFHHRGPGRAARRRARERPARGGACRVRTERVRRAHRVVQGVRERGDAPGPNRHGGEPDLYGARPCPRVHQTPRRAAGREGVGPRGGEGGGGVGPAHRGGARGAGDAGRGRGRGR